MLLAVLVLLVLLLAVAWVKGWRPGPLLFKLGYAVYRTRVGLWMHLRSLEKVKRPHSSFGASPLCHAFNGGRTMVYPIPFLSDNYAYLIVDVASSQAALVDAADPSAVASHLAAHPLAFPSLVITTLLCTHWHHDHSGGLSQMISSACPALPLSRTLRVVASPCDRVPGATTRATHLSTVTIGQHTTLTSVATPGHTRGHVCFLLGDAEALFSGDLLFVCGMGKLFECPPETAHQSLNVLLPTLLQPRTLIFPGHEYALKNLAFASSLFDGDQPVVSTKQAQVKALRQRSEPCIPSRWEDELTYNPFVRVQDPTFREALISRWQIDPSQQDPASLLGVLRRLKTVFDEQH